MDTIEAIKLLALTETAETKWPHANEGPCTG